jgi:hypothetical protein
VAVEAPNRVGCLGVAAVLDKRESARSAGVAISTDVNANDVSCRGEKLGELLLGCGEAQIANEDLGRNNALLCVMGLGLCVMGDGLRGVARIADGLFLCQQARTTRVVAERDQVSGGGSGATLEGS